MFELVSKENPNLLQTTQGVGVSIYIYKHLDKLIN